MQDKSVRYRVIQDGQPVAWTDGPNAFAEIKHYAAVYSQDGPVEIEKMQAGKWRKLVTLEIQS